MKAFKQQPPEPNLPVGWTWEFTEWASTFVPSSFDEEGEPSDFVPLYIVRYVAHREDGDVWLTSPATVSYSDIKGNPSPDAHIDLIATLVDVARLSLEQKVKEYE